MRGLDESEQRISSRLGVGEDVYERMFVARARLPEIGLGFI